MRPYMTEEEAKERVCPVLRGAHNQEKECLGSTCAWWGWEGGTENCHAGSPGAMLAGTRKDGTSRYIRPSTRGRCEAPGVGG